MQRAKLVQPEDEVSGELLFSAAAVYFVGNGDGDGVNDSSETGSPGSSSFKEGKHLLSLSWKMSALREVHRRWYQVGTENTRELVQRSAKVDAPGCVNAAGKLGQK